LKRVLKEEEARLQAEQEARAKPKRKRIGSLKKLT